MLNLVREELVEVIGTAAPGSAFVLAPARGTGGCFDRFRPGKAISVIVR